MENADQKLSCQPIGSQISAIVTNASDSVMNSQTSSSNLPTTTRPAATGSSTGMQLSTPGSATLRDLAVAATEGKMGVLTDQSLSATLTSHFGSRLAINPKTSYGTQDSPEFRITGYQVSISDAGISEVRMIEAMNRPVRAEFLAGKLSRLRVTMARRVESEKDFTMLIDTMMEIFKKYPADVIAAATDQWMKTKTFFPTIKEFTELMDDGMMLRRAVLQAMQKSAPQLSAPTEPRNWKQTPRAEWDMHMWAAWVADAEGMLVLAKENPVFLDVSAWQKEVEERRRQVPMV